MNELTKSLSGYDALCVLEALPSLKSHLDAHRKIDKTIDDDVSCFKADAFDCRVIYSPVNVEDYDDVRRYSQAAKKALERAVNVGILIKL